MSSPPKSSPDSISTATLHSNSRASASWNSFSIASRHRAVHNFAPFRPAVTTRQIENEPTTLPDFRTLFEKSPDAIGVSRRGVHLFVNPAYARLFGHGAPADLIDKPVLSIVAPSSRAEIADRIERRGRGEDVPMRYEGRGLRRDGAEFDFEINVSTFDLEGRQNTLVIVR